jgi:hypothetical protein
MAKCGQEVATLQTLAVLQYTETERQACSCSTIRAISKTSAEPSLSLAFFSGWGDAWAGYSGWGEEKMRTHPIHLELHSAVNKYT